MNPSTSDLNWPYPQWIAHRGAGHDAPENTLAAFQAGAASGFQMFECDVKISKDQVAFLMHDARLERTSNGLGMSGHLTWQELSKLDAGQWHSPAFAGEPIPTLQDLARFCLTHDRLLNIEIKPTPGLEYLTGEIVAQNAAALWHEAPVKPLLTSFQPASLRAAQRTAPHLSRGLLVDSLWESWLQTAMALECSAVVMNFKLLNPDLIAFIYEHGFKCLTYTVNNLKIAKQLMAWGVDGIITDNMKALQGHAP